MPKESCDWIGESLIQSLFPLAETNRQQQRLANCLRVSSKCGNIVRKCRTALGPCPQSQHQLFAARECRQLKQSLITRNGTVQRCEKSCNSSAALNQRLASIDGAASGLERCMVQCQHRCAEKDPVYITCVQQAFHLSMTECYEKHCAADIKECVASKCSGYNT